MAYITAYLEALWAIVLEASPWLVFGLIVSGLLKAYLPDAWLGRWLGGKGGFRGAGPIVLAGVVGTPLPLCSCSVVPAALTLRRGGASKGATVSFLISTPENGADSIALSYALLGPFMTVARPVAALVTAVATGLAVAVGDRKTQEPQKTQEPLAVAGCCGGGGCCGEEKSAKPQAASGWAKFNGGMRYAMVDLFDDIALWMVVGLMLAAGVAVFAPPEVMSEWGSGLGAMLLMLAIGVPMYICATASTPIAAAMLLAGVSPGTVLVFLLAGPATNLGTIAILHRELGTRSAAIYLAGIAICSVLLGLATDAAVGRWGIDVAAQAAGHEEFVPVWLAWASAAVFAALVGRVAWKRIARRVARRGAAAGAGQAEHPADAAAI